MMAFEKKVEIQAQGSDKFLEAVVKAVAWLCAAVRIWPHEGVMLSDTELDDKGNIKLLPLKDAAVMHGNCWHELFQAAVIVNAPPTSNREGRGLELSFNDMVYLAGAVVQLEVGHVTVTRRWRT